MNIFSSGMFSTDTKWFQNEQRGESENIKNSFWMLVFILIKISSHTVLLCINMDVEEIIPGI